MEALRLRGDRMAWQAVDGEVVGLDLLAARYFGANATGSLLWPLLSKGTSREELERVLLDTFGIDTDRARADVDSFLVALHDRGFLE